MDLEQKFTAAQNRVKQLPNQSNEVLLDLYRFFKQATSGDVSGKRPGMLDLRGRAKYDAWAKCQGMSRDEAMENYVGLVERLEQK